jgi:hypothetical protein
MSQRARWGPQPLLEERQWSLLPVVHLSVRSAAAMQAAWAAFAITFIVIRTLNLFSPFGFWLLGAWALFYITQRLGGRQAMIGGAAPKIRPDSPFQLRLLLDLFHLGVLGAMAAAIALGPPSIRALLPW